MDKFRKYIKNEADAEILACVHGMSLVFMYGFFLWINGIESIRFAAIFQMFLLGYAISWFQKLLFIKERVYSPMEYKIRSSLWSIGPEVMMIACQYIFRWFSGLPSYIVLIFDGVMMSYFVMIWIFIQVFYKDDTLELNSMLSDYKNRKGDGKK